MHNCYLSNYLVLYFKYQWIHLTYGNLEGDFRSKQEIFFPPVKHWVSTVEYQPS